MNATIIYYTSNQEDSKFEQKIRETILASSDLPIVSVSHKPIDFGLNIAVGNVGVSGFNMIRQILIACNAATTKYVISAEADCIYPPDYFEFRPPKDDVCYRSDNTYIIGHKRDYYWRKKEAGTWAQVVNREFYIKRLEFLLAGEPKWDATRKNFPKEKGLKFFDSFETFSTLPCISFKAKGMRHYSHSERIPIYDLPYWGDSKILRQYYLG